MKTHAILNQELCGNGEFQVMELIGPFTERQGMAHLAELLSAINRRHQLQKVNDEMSVHFNHGVKRSTVTVKHLDNVVIQTLTLLKMRT